MITTAIILESEDGIPIWHKSEGFAKNESVAKWLFDLCGWRNSHIYAELLVCKEVIEWPESDEYFPCEANKLWILGSCRYLN